MNKWTGPAGEDNNRKTTKGRHVTHKVFEVKPEVSNDKGYWKYESVLHLVSTDPRTGTQIFAKQGHGKRKEFRTVMEKGDTGMPRRYGMKQAHIV